MIENLNEWGKARANPYARVANALKLSDSCECTDAIVCQDSIPTLVNLTTIVVDGVTYNPNTQIKDASGQVIWNPTQIKPFYDPADNVDAAYFESFILAVLSQVEVDPYVIVDAEEETITHIGAYEITVTGSTTTRCCTFVGGVFDCE